MTKFSDRLPAEIAKRKFYQPSLRDLPSHRCRVPSDKSLGYSQMSLRDKFRTPNKMNFTTENTEHTEELLILNSKTSLCSLYY